MKTKNKIIALTGLAALLISTADAITFSGTAITDLNTPDVQTAILVVDTNNDGFLNVITEGDSLAAGSSIGADDYILQVTSTQDLGFINVAAFSAFSFNVGEGSIAASDSFAIYVFNGTTGTTAALGSFGIATDSSWLIPSQPAASFDWQPASDADSFSQLSGLSTGAFSVVAVPEPSTFAALAGLCALGAVMVRRRRA